MSTNEAFEAFVTLVDETVETAAEVGGDVEEVIYNSWSWDSQDRRSAFAGGFKEFRQHVLNVLDSDQT